MEKSSFINPYDVLGVSQTASDAEITKAFAMAMKRREHSPDVIAKARKSLMNSHERILADYLRPILPTIKRFKRKDFSELKVPEPSIELLPEFDGLEEAFANSSEKSDSNIPFNLVLQGKTFSVSE